MSATLLDYLGDMAEQFKINWTGSLLVPDTGEYDFRVTTPNGVRVYVNAPANGSEKNALIDLWVSSAMLRSGQGQAFLLGRREVEKTQGQEPRAVGDAAEQGTAAAEHHLGQLHLALDHRLAGPKAFQGHRLWQAQPGGHTGPDRGVGKVEVGIGHGQVLLVCVRSYTETQPSPI